LLFNNIHNDERTQSTLYNGRTASLRLHILVVGCGLGGLAAAHTLSQAGHTVTLLESASALGEVGAGIQVTPNVSRLLRRWGLGAAFDAVSVKPEAIVLRRYADGDVVGYTSWRGMEARYGTPYWHVHRADFHRLLVGLLNVRVVDGGEEVQESVQLEEKKNGPGEDDHGVPVTLRLKSTVVAVNPGGPPGEGGRRASVTLSSGEVLEGDVIIGADGVKSFVQSVVLHGAGKRATPPRATGDAVYRATIPADVMLRDPDLKPFIDTPEMTGWMGPRRHIMAYCIVSTQRPATSLDCVMAHRGYVCDDSEQRKSSTSSSRTPTTGPWNHGRRRAVPTRCAPTLLILSRGQWVGTCYMVKYLT
jgi:salicylate hydroxylase